MLEGLRTASQHKIGRIVLGFVMGLIALSFAVFGIGDVFRGAQGARLVKLGSGEISVEAYRSAYQNELRRLQQRARRAVTNAEARRLGLDQQVLQRLVTELALDQKAKALGLAISEEETLRLTRDESAFKGPSGKFDADRFKQLVRDAGYTERGFLVEQKATYLRKTLIDSVGAQLEPPRLLLEALHKFRSEARDIDHFLLPASTVGETPAPTEDELKKFFDDREQSFRAREYRTLVLLSATPATLAEPGQVSEAEARKRYDTVKAKRYGTAEKRHLRQILFATEEEAKAALERLAGGLSFDALAAERKLSAKDIDLGLLEARDLGDEKLSEQVFASPKPGFVGPVKTAFGAAVLEIEKIVPSVVTRSFEEAADELRREIATERAAPRVRKLHDAVEDQRAAGKPLAEAAAAAGLEARTVDAVDSLGLDKSGKEIPGLFGSEDLLKAAFASDVGVDNDTVATRDGGFVWFEVAKVEPARQRPFEEVKDAVAAALRAEKLSKALSEKADTLVAEIRAGKTIEDAAWSVGARLEHTPQVKRAANPQLPSAAVIAAFDAPPHGAGSAPVEGGRLIFFVKNAATPPYDPDSLDAKTAAEQLRPAFVNDILEQYVGALEKQLNVAIDEAALERAIRSEQGP